MTRLKPQIRYLLTQSTNMFFMFYIEADLELINQTNSVKELLFLDWSGDGTP